MPRAPVEIETPHRVHEHSPAEVAEWTARGWDKRVDCGKCVHRVGYNCEVFPKSMIVLHMVRHCDSFAARAMPRGIREEHK